jgi:hypothetical protein
MLVSKNAKRPPSPRWTRFTKALQMLLRQTKQFKTTDHSRLLLATCSAVASRPAHKALPRVDAVDLVRVVVVIVPY